jgi:hypothetical protein
MANFKLFGLNKSDEKVFYTGRAGIAWVSTNEAEAFEYATYEAAKAKADRHNVFSPVHGIYLVPDNGQ